VEEMNRELEKQRRRHAENVGIFGRKRSPATGPDRTKGFQVGYGSGFS